MKYRKIILTCIMAVVFCGASYFLSKTLSVKAEEKNDIMEDAGAQERLYGIGSVSKVYTAAAVMKLVDEGKVNLDDPVKKYIPDFEMADERYRKITVRMLLNHSSGLNGGTSCDSILLNDNSTYNHDHFLENLKNQKLKAEPGEFSVYCNDGFTLAEILVERVSNMSFTQFMEEKFYKELGLTNTRTPQNSDDKVFAKIYFDNSSLELEHENANVIGSGGIASTPEEMCKFSQIFMKDTNKILSRNSAHAMMNFEEKNNKYGYISEDGAVNYGLGWDSVNTYPFNKFNIKALTKCGDTNSYHGVLTVLPDNNMSVSILSSGGTSSINQIIAQELLKGLLIKKGVISDFSESDILHEYKNINIPEEIKQNAGIYCSDKMLKISFKDEKMLISTIDDEINVTQEYVYTDKGYFISTNGDYISCDGQLVSAQNGSVGNTKLYFKKETNGITYIYIQTYERYPGIGNTAKAIPYAQKIDENKVSSDVMNVWKERENKKYYLINEKYTSSNYMLKSRNHIKIDLSDGMEGYLKNTDLYKNSRIINENYAQDFSLIPGMIGRDTNDFEFYKRGNVEFLKLPTIKDEFISEEAIKYLDFTDGNITVDDDNAKWFKIYETDEGKEISINIKGNGNYFVYDKYDNCIDSSVIKNKKRIIYLPVRGKIVFVGEKGTKFEFK